MIKKRIGKITSAYFGLGGYQDCMIGLHFTFSSANWSVGSNCCSWDPHRIKRPENADWTEESRDIQMAETVRFTSKILSDAKKDSVEELVGVPVEVEFDGNIIKDWRVLKEAI